MNTAETSPEQIRIMTPSLDDKTAETLASIGCLLALIALVYVAPEYNSIIIPVIIGIVIALTGAEAGRRRGKRHAPSDGSRSHSNADSGRTGYETNAEYQERARRRE